MFWEDKINNYNQESTYTETPSSINLTLDYIQNNIDQVWNWIDIWFNPLTRDKEDFMNQEYRKHLAVILIQNAWKNERVNLNCPLGLKTIQRDMDFAGLA